MTDPAANPPPASSPDASRAAYGALAATLVLWAVSFPAAKAAMRSFGPGELALLRFAISSVALLAYVRARDLPLPALADMPRLALAGFLAVTVYQIGFNFGLTRVSSGPAAVLIDTIPVWAALFSWLLLRERMHAAGWIGLTVGFAGAVLIAFGEQRAAAGVFEAGSGAALLLMAAVAFAAAAVVQKPLLPKYGALQVTAWSFVFGTVGLGWALPGLMPQVESAPRNAMLAVAFLALLPGALAYVLWNQALARLPIALAASSLYLVPPLTFAAAWVWLGEMPGPLSWAGAAVALGGVALVQFKGREVNASSSSELLFVYGTLRAGCRNDIARIAPAARYFAAARVRGRLYDLGHYPALLLDAQADWVAGELYEVPAAAWPALDALEEPVTPEHPDGEYFKHTAEVELADGGRRNAWIYSANQAVIDQTRPITGGDWIAHAVSRNKPA